MRTVLLVAEAVGTTLLMLTLTAPPAYGQTLGEVTAATGIHGTLSRQSVGSAAGTLGSVKSSLAKSTQPKDLGFGSSASSGLGSSRRNPMAPGSGSRAGRSGGSSSSGRGSWVTAASTSRGNTSSAWLQGGGGWATGGGGGRSSGSRRPRPRS